MPISVIIEEDFHALWNARWTIFESAENDSRWGFLVNIPRKMDGDCAWCILCDASIRELAE
jgi:hypothetical protein